ncbi:MAG: PqqD family protein [Brevibacillus sp.]|nr:PqqD family protein [Brevibacillus sp.]
MYPNKDVFVQCRVINNTKYLAKNNEVYQLDEVGEQVWDLLDGKTSIEQIADHIARKYQVDSNMVLNDIQKFIQELVDKNLVEV